MADYLRGIGESIHPRPRALLVVSAHWETPKPTLNDASHPPLLFDYYGFPEHTYRLTYPVSGAPDVADRAATLLADAGLESARDSARGLDHGVFVPFKLIYPRADIPIVQLSLLQNLDPAAHLAVGRALAPLRGEGVLIVGSGMSYHNLRAFMVDDDRAGDAAERFDRWLDEAVTCPDLAERERQLLNWKRAPAARLCHPREEHLIPLMVAAGAAGTDRGRRTYNQKVLGKAISGFQFG